MADDIDALAGEYVLGTLDASEHKAFQRRLLTDPAAVAAVSDWQARLSPLLLAIPAAQVPAGLWGRIDTNGRPANDNAVLRRWQAATAAATLLALVTIGLTFRPQPTAQAPAQLSQVPQASALYQSVAALSETGSKPALLVTYDDRTRKMRVTPVNVNSRPGHSLELWVIAGKLPPRSIGLMKEHGATALDRPAIDLRHENTIAVSVEPEGGSPTGAPTGPVIYSGQMIRLTTS